MNRAAGAIVTVDENPISVIGFTITAGRITEIQILLSTPNV